MREGNPTVSYSKLMDINCRLRLERATNSATTVGARSVGHPTGPPPGWPGTRCGGSHLSPAALTDDGRKPGRDHETVRR
jgi:hypothetical protein